MFLSSEYRYFNRIPLQSVSVMSSLLQMVNLSQILFITLFYDGILSTLNLSKLQRIRNPSDKIITFNILASCDHRLLPFFIHEVFSSFFLLKLLARMKLGVLRFIYSTK